MKAAGPCCAISVAREGPVEQGGYGVERLRVKVPRGLPSEAQVDMIRDLIADSSCRKWIYPGGTIVVDARRLCPDARTTLTGYLSSTGCFEEVLIPRKHGDAQSYLVVGGKDTRRIGSSFKGGAENGHRK